MAKDDGSSNSDKDYWIGFDLGGTKMLAIVFDSKFKSIGKSRKKTKGFEGMQAGLKRINSVIYEAIEDAGLSKSQVSGLGIGCPGPLNSETGIVFEAPNLGWTDVPVQKSIESEFGFPVVIANDVDAGVFGEYSFGAGKDARCVVGIFPGTGIGAGCVYEGKILRGKNTSCMEIGHIPILPGGPLDGAGNPGSLEGIASRLAIAGQLAQAAYRGSAPSLLTNAGTDISQIRSGAIAAAIEAGDEVVRSIVEDACQNIALGVVTVVHLIAPDVIVFGGGLIEAMPDLMLGKIREFAQPRILQSLRNEFEIREAELGDDAGVMGAAALAQQSVKEQK